MKFFTEFIVGFILQIRFNCISTLVFVEIVVAEIVVVEIVVVEVAVVEIVVSEIAIVEIVVVAIFVVEIVGKIKFQALKSVHLP